MNQVLLIGRLTRDPEVRYGAASQTAVARFTIAIDRGKDKDGNDRGADFPSIVCFGKTAENVERFVKKGQLVGVTGSIHTDSYEKDGRKIYTTEVQAQRVEFLGKNTSSESPAAMPADNPFDNAESEAPSGFEKLTDDDIPF